MKASIVITSNGEIIDASQMQNVFRVKGEQSRKEELDTYRAALSSVLEDVFPIPAEGFYRKIQPYYTNDKLIFGIKVPLEPSNSLVIRANKHFPQDENSADMDVLKSVYYTQQREKTVWYILYVASITFERNVYDCQYEGVYMSKPVLYSDFLQIWDKDTIPQDVYAKRTVNKGYIYIDKADFRSIDTILKNAVVYENNGLPLNDIQQIKAIVYDFFQHIGFSEKKNYANQAFECLRCINNLRYEGSIFSLYERVKPLIKEVLPTSKTVRYDMNRITFDFNGRKNTIYVCGPNEKGNDLTLVINGRIYPTVEDLISNIHKAIQPCEWFNTVVLSNIK